MKIAIFSTGNLSDFKGVMNYVHEKVLRFQQINDESVKTDFLFLTTKYTGLLGLLKAIKGENNKYQTGDVVKINGVDYHIVVLERCLLDILISFIFKKFILKNNINRVSKLFKEYDIISSHQLPCHYIAYQIKKQTKKPFIATWHGSDINVSPKISKRNYDLTKMIMEAADQNYFVSKALLKASDYITTNAYKEHIYTGPSSIFFKYSEEKRKELRKQFEVENVKVITFAGNLIDIKNVLVLPSVFKALQQKIPNKKIKFWIIGDGNLGEELKIQLEQSEVDYRLFGKIDSTQMPDYMNCTDILIMPSKNEGFSLAVLEAISCGSCVVASKVGGLPESAGENNCFALDNSFVDNISTRMSDIIYNNEIPIPLPDEYSWDSAVKKEITKIKKILG